ncbi:hypothetical protein HPB51_028012 [Rhipicephalus microplus]|uniref:Endonuclease/exonuclease/phosphatase domain-containing protein n=1 Tax=Rhipicephalus microplus TaxID=6941 RepID=A0A9J6CYI3_RHIMP|nr:hypothetical protein HPB51_028012 [Rhipicephalus microplus]
MHAEGHKVCTLVKRKTAFLDHSLDISEELDIDHNRIEVVPCIGNWKTGLFVLNVYNPTSKRGLTHNFGALCREAMANAASSRLLICGDFNAPRTQWGYGADSPEGKKLAELMDELGLVLPNEPASHTQIGQGACRDTSPDLSVWSDAGAITWSNTFEDLGSNHRVLCMTMERIEAKCTAVKKLESCTGTSFESKENERSRKGRLRISGNGAGNYSRT